MRCIEMTTTSDEQLAMALININMRCIEIAIYDFFATDKYRLTLTWDVLKYDVDVEKLTDGVD